MKLHRVEITFQVPQGNSFKLRLYILKGQKDANKAISIYFHIQ